MYSPSVLLPLLFAARSQIAKTRDMVAIADAMLKHDYGIGAGSHGGKCLTLDGKPVDADLSRQQKGTAM